MEFSEIQEQVGTFFNDSFMPWIKANGVTIVGLILALIALTAIVYMFVLPKPMLLVSATLIDGGEAPAIEDAVSIDVTLPSLKTLNKYLDGPNVAFKDMPRNSKLLVTAKSDLETIIPVKSTEAATETMGDVSVQLQLAKNLKAGFSPSETTISVPSGCSREIVSILTITDPNYQQNFPDPIELVVDSSLLPYAGKYSQVENLEGENTIIIFNIPINSGAAQSASGSQTGAAEVSGKLRIKRTTVAQTVNIKITEKPRFTATLGSTMFIKPDRVFLAVTNDQSGVPITDLSIKIEGDPEFVSAISEIQPPQKTLMPGETINIPYEVRNPGMGEKYIGKMIISDGGCGKIEIPITYTNPAMPQ